MLNIGRLAPGGEQYYLATVASGVEEYYTGAGEAPGRWTAAASGALGLRGQVSPDQLRAVLGGREPGTGRALGRPKSGRKIPGFDLTFRAPKSVSLLWGLTDTATAAQVRDAHDAAVAAALAYLENEAAWTRKGHGGKMAVKATGFVAAAFRHRTSRAGDPLLHSHVLVANLAKAVDEDKWRTLDARRIYTHAKTAGYLYQAQLRHELAARLGVEWGPVVNGYADLAGISELVIREFSQRRQQIEAAMIERGTTSARAAQAATLETRQAKDRAIDAAALGVEWVTRAAVHGLTPDTLHGLLGRARPRPACSQRVLSVVEDMLGPAGLTRQRSTFDRRDVISDLAQRLGGDLDAETVVALADAIIHAPDSGLVALPTIVRRQRRGSVQRGIRGRDSQASKPTCCETRFTTTELLAVEQRLLEAATSRRDEGTGIVNAETVHRVLAARPTLADEQAAMVRRLTGSGNGVDVVVGKAGAGKTFALDAARAAWEADGYRVLGGALAARAALQLRDGAGIDSHTVHRLLEWFTLADDRGHLDANTVVVLDEAGMIDTRTMARLLRHAQRHAAKVVLVGDHRQLPEIDAGGAFRSFAERLPVIELTQNRRQRHQWERAALDELADGSVGHAVAAYHDHDRLTVGEGAADVREAMVDDWWTARSEFPDAQLILLAKDRVDVDDLNRRARNRILATGGITGPEIAGADGKAYAVGDRIRCLRNRRMHTPADKPTRVTNGAAGTVIATHPQAGELTVELDAGGQVQLNADYLADGYVDYGWATTTHKAQGATYQRAFVLGTDASYRQWGYVAMSRASDHTQLYTMEGRDPEPEIDHHGHAPSTNTPQVELARALNRDLSQRLATDHPPVADVSAKIARPGDRHEVLPAAVQHRLQEATQSPVVERHPSTPRGSSGDRPTDHPDLSLTL